MKALPICQNALPICQNALPISQNLPLKSGTVV